MKRLLIFLLLTLPLIGNAQQKKVAVYVTGEDAGINKVLGSKLVSAIARSNEYSAIERTESFLAELSKEQSYQRTGAVDDSELSRLGKQFGVQYICVAAVSEAFNEKYLSARLIDVETAQVERTASSSGAIQSLESLVTAANAVSTELLSSLGRGRQSNIKKVAVYVVKSDAAKNIGRVLGDKLVAGFTSSGRYMAIERTNSFLSQISKEQNYQHSGAVDDNDLSRLGKQFGVQYVCVADVSDVFNEKYISARLIDVETAEVVNTHDAGGEMNDMSSCLRMANEIAANLSKGTFAEQAEEARIKAKDDARRRREEEIISREKAEKERKRTLVRKSISKYYLESIGFYFPRTTIKKSTIHKEGHTIVLKCPLYFDFYGYDCYGGKYTNGLVNGLVYLKSNYTDHVKLMYIINNEIMYPYLECCIYQGKYHLSLEEGRCSYGCFSDTNRPMCRNFSEIYNIEITTDQFKDGLFNMTIPLKDLENAFLDFIGSGKHLEGYDCR